MREAGIDLSGAQPQQLTDDLARTAQWLVTMGCGEQCPHVPGLRRDDWPLADPKGAMSRKCAKSGTKFAVASSASCARTGGRERLAEV